MMHQWYTGRNDCKKDMCPKMYIRTPSFFQTGYLIDLPSRPYYWETQLPEVYNFDLGP